MVPELFRGPVVEGGWAPENGSTSSFFSIRSGPGGVLRGGSGVPSDGFEIHQSIEIYQKLQNHEIHGESIKAIKKPMKSLGFGGVEKPYKL